ncbi:uncharacterized protein LOC102804429 [Saccoglossus kowalevskii]|uniref:Uncharacterized protein LOC102804429 n=1 Tax=Saccoglossus kowalevskii TaxID=10224 RepID=A0ABM0LY18_SACKO|nr:PREDICTED: uncharacterized protein LOC102804429 [Saccoglossus kowalevskii]
MERIQYRALKYVYNDFQSSYQTLLEHAGLQALEMSRNRDILVEVYKSVNKLSPSFIWDLYKEKNILKLYSFIQRSQIGELRPAIEYGRKSIKIRETLSGDQHKFKMGLSLMTLAFNLESWNGLGGDSSLSPEEAIEEGMKHIKEAITIFTELGDDGHLAEAIMTKGVLYPRGSIEQLKYYEESMELCLQTYGEIHVLRCRQLLNIGIYYEDVGDYYKAYDFFKKWTYVTEQLYGLEHPKTKRAISTLEEPMYVRIARNS